jgi:hypothetical protein
MEKSAQNEETQCMLMRLRALLTDERAKQMGADPWAAEKLRQLYMAAAEGDVERGIWRDLAKLALGRVNWAWIVEQCQIARAERRSQSTH